MQFVAVWLVYDVEMLSQSHCELVHFISTAATFQLQMDTAVSHWLFVVGCFLRVIGTKEIFFLCTIVVQKANICMLQTRPPQIAYKFDIVILMASNERLR